LKKPSHILGWIDPEILDPAEEVPELSLSWQGVLVVTIHRESGYGSALSGDFWTGEEVRYILIELSQQLPQEREIAGTGAIALLKSEFPNCKRLTDKPVLGWGSLRGIHKTRNIGILNSIDPGILSGLPLRREPI
jgi:hypothetical protein